MASFSTLALLRDSSIVIAPSFGAGTAAIGLKINVVESKEENESFKDESSTVFSYPRKLPMGVLAALAMTTSLRLRCVDNEKDLFVNWPSPIAILLRFDEFFSEFRLFFCCCYFYHSQLLLAGNLKSAAQCLCYRIRIEKEQDLIGQSLFSCYTSHKWFH